MARQDPKSRRKKTAFEESEEASQDAEQASKERKQEARRTTKPTGIGDLKRADDLQAKQKKANKRVAESFLRSGLAGKGRKKNA